MQFKVVRPFRDLDGIVKAPGCTLEIDFGRASMLRRLGLIGQVAPVMPRKKAVRKKREQAIKPPGETRGGHKSKKSKKQKKQKIAPPESAEGKVKNGAETGIGTGD